MILDMEMMKETLILLFLFINAWKDWKKKEISLFFTALAAAWGILGLSGRENGWQQFLAAVGIGLLLAVFSVLTRGAAGMGDALLLSALGMLLDLDAFFTLVCWGMLLAGLYSLILLTVKKKKKDTEIPLAPFLFAAYVGGLCL